MSLGVTCVGVCECEPVRVCVTQSRGPCRMNRVKPSLEKTCWTDGEVSYRRGWHPVQTNSTIHTTCHHRLVIVLPQENLKSLCIDGATVDHAMGTTLAFLLFLLPLLSGARVVIRFPKSGGDSGRAGLSVCQGVISTPHSHLSRLSLTSLHVFICRPTRDSGR